VFCLSCSPTTYTHGVPNLAEVDNGLWRSGQPTTLEAWTYLHSIGVKHVVKLNFESEGSDALAEKVGIDVTTLSIEPNGDVVTIFDPPNEGRVVVAISLLGPGWLVHCSHGQDRTGYVVGRYRVERDGWTKGDAYHEMLDHHFHPELPGLHEAWEDFRP